MWLIVWLGPDRSTRGIYTGSCVYSVSTCMLTMMHFRLARTSANKNAPELIWTCKLIEVYFLLFAILWLILFCSDYDLQVNVTQSVLRFMPTWWQDGQTLTCLAYNPLISQLLPSSSSSHSNGTLPVFANYPFKDRLVLDIKCKYSLMLDNFYIYPPSHPFKKTIHNWNW